jgi:hypothetical protein
MRTFQKQDQFQHMLTTALDARLKTFSRRSMLRTTAITGGSAAALTLLGGSVFAQYKDSTPSTEMGESMTESPFEGPVDVVNYALTLEHLETAFYRDGLAAMGASDFTAIGFDASVYDKLTSIAAHEAAHVEALTGVVNQLGGEPAAEGMYDFGYTDATSFLAVALALEDTGTAAYGGAAQYLIDEDELLTAALTIHGVEARHAAYLALLNAGNPFPDATNAPLTPQEVLDIATPFIVG